MVTKTMSAKSVAKYAFMFILPAVLLGAIGFFMKMGQMTDAKIYENMNIASGVFMLIGILIVMSAMAMGTMKGHKAGLESLSSNDKLNVMFALLLLTYFKG